MPDRPPPSPIRRLLGLLWQQPLWAVPFALFFGTLNGATARSYAIAYQLSVVFAYFIGLALWATYYLVLPRLPQGAETGRQALRIGLVYAGMCLAASYAAAALIHVTIFPGFLGSAQDVAAIGMYSLLFIALFTGIRYAMAYHDLAVARARAVEQARAELAGAELRALRAQINPHFLFNTLNSIASLIAANPPAAEEITTRLAEVFRYVLQASERERSPLGEELQFLRSYLEIERVRFGNRLRIEENVEPGLERLPVPSLLLQPLVENAVRHGVAPRPGGGTIRLSARKEAQGLVLEVADDGAGFDGSGPVSGPGFGLHATRERLRATGLRDALHINATPGGGTRVRVTLPIPSSLEPQA